MLCSCLRHYTLTITKSEEVYAREEEAKVKERLFLILRVELGGAISASAPASFIEVGRGHPFGLSCSRRKAWMGLGILPGV